MPPSPALTVAPVVAVVGYDGGSDAPRSLTSYPRPLRKSAAAADAYASAMQDLRDGTVEAAQVELQLAVKLDPTYAAAYVRLLSSWWQESFSRVSAQK